MLIRRLTIILLSLQVLSACQKETLPEMISEKSIGPAGGTIETESGVLLTIPEGALTGTTLVKITKVNPASVPAQLPGAPFAGDIFSFEPHGLEFNKPVQIELPTSTRANTVLKLSGPEDTHWKLVSAIDLTEDKAIFETSSFSMYAAGGSAATGSRPGGLFSSTVTFTAPSCIPVTGAPGVEICDEKSILRIEIIEESTSEIMASASFNDGNMGATSHGSAGYVFWCEKTDMSGMNSVQIKIYSPQANLPLVHAYWYSTEGPNRTTAGILYHEYVHASVVTGPDGTAYSDPYQKANFKFGGFKQLTFNAKDEDLNFMNENALTPLKNAGYDAVLRRYTKEGSMAVAEIDVYGTLDARVLMEQNILVKKKWKVKSDAGATKGNRGTYQFTPPLEIGATPIFVTDKPSANEKPVSGNILITRSSEGVTDAIVKLNGVLIPHSGDGLYDVAAVDVPSIAPGSPVIIEATTVDPPDSRELIFYCPPAVQFTSPNPGTLVSNGQNLNVTWSPAIPYDHAMRMSGGAMLGVFACYTKPEGNEVSSMGHGSDFITLKAGQTNQSITLEACRRYLLELQYPGERVLIIEEDGAVQFGYCTQRRRMWLMGAGT